MTPYVVIENWEGGPLYLDPNIVASVSAERNDFHQSASNVVITYTTGISNRERQARNSNEAHALAEWIMAEVMKRCQSELQTNALELVAVRLGEIRDAIGGR